MRVLVIVVLVLSGCWHEHVETCACKVENTPKAPAVAPDPPMTRVMARAVIGKLSPKDRATLAELWLMYELQDLNGNEDDPQRLLRRLETELATPVVANPAAVRDALVEARRIFTTVTTGTTTLSGYDQASKVGAPVLAIILSPLEIETRIEMFPTEIGAAWLVDQYFSEHHYHNYNMRNRLWELIASTYGRRALAVIEHRLRDSAPESSESTAGEYWKASTTAARAILGHEFPAWYRKIRGTSYREDLAASRGEHR